MSVATIKPIVSAEDVAALPGEQLKLVARAALAAGYVVDLRNIRYENMIFANGKHFHPLTNWEQCVRLIVTTESSFVVNAGMISMYTASTDSREVREPSTDAEYRIQMCDAVVTNVAKGFPV